MSFAMSLLISVDRHLAITLKHRYRSTVTKKRVLGTIILTYLLFIISSIALVSDKVYPYWNYVAGVSGVVCLLATCAFYTKSLVALRHLSTQVNAQLPSSSQRNFDAAKYKKSLNTMIIILAFLLVCCIPLVCVPVVFATVGVTKFYVIFDLVSFTIFGLNSSLNPLIYIIRFTDIRNACRERLTSFIFHQQRRP